MSLSSTHVRLRALVALLALVCGGWAQAARLACPMGAPTEAVAHAAAGDRSAHGGHAEAITSGSVLAVTENHSGSDHEPSCRLMLGCASAGLTAPTATVELATGLTRGAARRFGPDLHATTFPTHEPPPPRLAV